MATHVLVLTHNEALGSILASTLCGAEIKTHRAICVRDAISLLRLHPINFLVCDFEVSGQNVLGFVPALRRAVPYRDFETLALTSHVDGDVQNICRSVAIDEVVVKPCSPRFLRERIIVRSEDLRPRPEFNYYGENIVSLFESKSPNKSPQSPSDSLH